ncbi:MAG: HK97 gp10 family phage protein [Candidatus Nanoarchaeia archaeon]|jgi:hypothetical protein
MEIRITSNFTDKSVDFEKKFLDFFYKTVLEAQGDARRYAPVDTSNLRRQIQIEWINPFKAILRSNAEYSKFVEEGYGPFTIQAVNKQALHWKKGGKDFFAKVVHHPGFAGVPFMRPARDNAERKFKEFLIK